MEPLGPRHQMAALARDWLLKAYVRAKWKCEVVIED